MSGGSSETERRPLWSGAGAGSVKRLHAVLVALLAGEVAGILWLVLDPSPATPAGAVARMGAWLAGHGAPTLLTQPTHVEFVLNLTLFVPLGVLAPLVWPRVRWWAWLLAGVAVSSALELFQLAFLDGRSASLADLCSNSLGMAVGVGLAWGARAARTALRRR